MTILLCLTALITIPLLAAKGKAYRGVYGAIAVCAVLVAFLVFSLMGSSLNASTANEAIGQEFINDVAPYVIFIVLSIGIGGVLGAMLYRPRGEGGTRQIR